LSITSKAGNFIAVEDGPPYGRGSLVLFSVH
jgi:hypothetical protein